MNPIEIAALIAAGATVPAGGTAYAVVQIRRGPIERLRRKVVKHLKAAPKNHDQLLKWQNESYQLLRRQLVTATRRYNKSSVPRLMDREEHKKRVARFMEDLQRLTSIAFGRYSEDERDSQQEQQFRADMYTSWSVLLQAMNVVLSLPRHASIDYQELRDLMQRNLGQLINRQYPELDKETRKAVRDNNRAAFLERVSGTRQADPEPVLSFTDEVLNWVDFPAHLVPLLETKDRHRLHVLVAELRRLDRIEQDTQKLDDEELAAQIEETINAGRKLVREEVTALKSHTKKQTGRSLLDEAKVSVRYLEGDIK